MYWLAEQGLAAKRALFVVIPLIIFFLMEHIKYVLKRKGDKNMGKTKNAFDALNVILNCIINIRAKMKRRIHDVAAIYENQNIFS